MPKRTNKEIIDINILASKIIEEITKEPAKEEKPEKNTAAFALGRVGGLMGGKTRTKTVCQKSK